jgi:hypothetical protein
VQHDNRMLARYGKHIGARCGHLRGDLPSGFRTSSEPVAIQTTVVAGRLTGTLLATAIGHGGRTVLGNAGRGGRKSCLSIVYRKPRDAGSKRQESGDAIVKDRQRDKAGSDGMGRGPRRDQQGWTATHQHQRDRRDLHLCLCAHRSSIDDHMQERGDGDCCWAGQFGDELEGPGRTGARGCLLAVAVAVAVAVADAVRLLADLTVRVGRSCTPDY